MNFTTTILPRSRVEVRAEVPYETLEPLLPKAAKLISESLEIPGFRKGTAPYEKVRDVVGEFRILEEAARLLIRKQYPDIMRELTGDMKHETRDMGQKIEPIEPIGQPDIAITKLAKGEPLAYTITLSFIPAFALPDYKKAASRITKNKKEISVEQKEIDDALLWLRESRAKLVTVSRAAQKGDRVELDFTALHAGVELENGKSQNHPLVIGEGRFVPGFEENLINMKANEEKKFSLVVPQNYHEKNLAGKELEFSVLVRLVQERTLPELTDDFAKSLGNFENTDALQKNIREGITEEKTAKERDRIRGEIIEVLCRETKLELPEVLIDAEHKKMLEELKNGTGRMGLKWEDYMTHIKKSEDDLKKDWLPDAEKRVTTALLLREIAKKEGIAPSAEEVQEAASRWISQSNLSPEELKKIDKEGLRQYALGVVRNEKVFEFLENTSAHG